MTDVLEFDPIEAMEVTDMTRIEAAILESELKRFHEHLKGLAHQGKLEDQVENALTDARVIVRECIQDPDFEFDNEHHLLGPFK